jgi:hypothetical protein
VISERIKKENIYLSGMKHALFFCFLVWSGGIFSQDAWKGTVLDSESKRPMPFVNVLVYHGKQLSGTTTNVEGNFSVSLSPRPDSVAFSFVGYQRLSRTTFSDTRIFLTPTELQSKEIEIRPGLNPALRIIRNAVANRKENDVQKNLAYTHDTYNVFNADVDSLVQPDSDKLKDSSEVQTANFFLRQQAFLMETYSKVQYKPVNNRKETIIATRTSGLKNPLLSTVMAQLQPFSAYENPINLFSTEYLNPISASGMGGYYYELRDTLYDKADTIFLIEFAPKPGHNFKGVKGRVFIHSEKWAITNAIFEIESLLGMDISEDKATLSAGGETKNRPTTNIIIAYDRLANGFWFPKEVRTIIPLGKLFSNSTFAIWNTSFFRNIQFDLDKKEIKTGGAPIEVIDEATERDEAFWAELKGETLNERDKETYRFNDSVSESVNLDRRLNTLTSLAQGYIRIKWFDLDILRIIDYNNFESFRLGLGGRTNERMAKWMSLGAYGAYGFGDKRFKYGGDVTFHLKRSHQFNLRIAYSDDVVSTGDYHTVNPTKQLDQGELYRKLYIKRMDYTQNLAFELEGYVFKSFLLAPFSTTNAFGRGMTITLWIRMRFRMGDSLNWWKRDWRFNGNCATTTSNWVVNVCT